MSDRASTFITASAARSKIADLLCSKDKGRAAFCDPSGVAIEIQGNRRVLPYDRLVEVVAFEGRFWGTVTFAIADGAPYIVSGLPKAAAATLAQALDHIP